MSRDELMATDPRERRAALESLASSGTALDTMTIDLVVECLGVPDKATQRLAADVLRAAARDQRSVVVARLHAALARGAGNQRFGAAYALGRLGVADESVVDALLATLGETDGDRRWAAAELLTACARVDRDRVVPHLLAAAAHADEERRKMALYVLRHAAPGDPQVHAAALRALVDPALGVRFAALAAVVRLVPLPAEACALVLTRVHEDLDDGFRRAAVCALGDVGRGVSAAERAIAAAETSDDPRMRRAAAIARRRLAARDSSP